jgi:uroporphyrinogen-III decarboxylase
MALWGGVSLEHLILDGDPHAIRRDVRAALEKGAAGGGFILGPSHSIAKGTRYENFMAMLDEFDKLRGEYGN